MLYLRTRKFQARQFTCRAFVVGLVLAILAPAAPVVAAGAVIGFDGAAVATDLRATGVADARDAVSGLRTAQVVGAPPGGGWVCFYKSPGFAGAKWCVGPGTMMPRITRAGWDDAISSVRMSPGMSVRVCSKSGLMGKCIILSRSRTGLDQFDDAISSFSVYGGDPRAL